MLLKPGSQKKNDEHQWDLCDKMYRSLKLRIIDWPVDVQSLPQLHLKSCCVAGPMGFPMCQFVNISQQSSWKRPRVGLGSRWHDQMPPKFTEQLEFAATMQLRWRKFLKVEEKQEKRHRFCMQIARGKLRYSMIQPGKTGHPAWSDQWPVHQIAFPHFSSREIGASGMLLSLDVNLAQSAKGNESQHALQACTKNWHPKGRLDMIELTKCFAPHTSNAFPENIGSTS